MKQVPFFFPSLKGTITLSKYPLSQTIESELTSASPAQLQRDPNQNGRLHGELGLYGLHLNIYGRKTTNCH